MYSKLYLVYRDTRLIQFRKKREGFGSAQVEKIIFILKFTSSDIIKMHWHYQF